MTNTSKWLQKYNYEPLDWFMSEARKTGTKVHALGCNNLQLMKKYRFYSTDSSVHSIGGRFGYVIGIKNGRIKNLNPKKTVKCNRAKVNEHNVRQMLEIMKYAEQKL